MATRFRIYHLFWKTCIPFVRYGKY